MIEVKKVRKLYQMGEVDTVAVRQASFKIEDGEYVLLTGRSGSGKSTMLNMLTGVDKPTSGEVWINGKEISGFTEEQLAKWRGNEIGIVFQFFQLIPTLSVIENILLPMDVVNSIPKHERERKAMQILECVGLATHRDKMPSALSGGEQQRVAIARCLANDAPIIFADEPTGNLDTENANRIYQLLCRLHNQGKTIVMVTHERVEIPGVTRNIVMGDGKVIEDIRYKEEKKNVC